MFEFLRYLLRHLRGHVIVLWDKGRIHKGDPIGDFCRKFPRLRLEHFPPYAPELNPDEAVWGLTKSRLPPLTRQFPGRGQPRPARLTYSRGSVRVVTLLKVGS